MTRKIGPIQAKPAEQRKIGFAAPEQIHGVLKQVVGWAEMSEIRPSGVTFTEREFLQGLICAFLG